MVNFTCPVIFDKPLDPKPFFENGNINFKAHDVGWLVCGVMTLIATVASIWLIWKHLTYYTCPQQQRHIVRLLVMVPVYAIVSFMSYLFYHEALYYQTIRDCYEAVLVTSFFYLILAYTGDTNAEQHAVFRNLKFERWVFPLGSLRYKPEGLHFLWIMKISVLQYAIVRPLCTFAAVGLEYFGYYCLHSWMPWFGHVWCAILISISVTVAMFCLIQLYVPVRQLVDPNKPILKFLSIKTIVFLTFWQDTLLSFLVSFNVIKETEYFTADQIQAGINALLQCFWMMVFGFVHVKAFSYLPYRPADEKRTTLRGRAMLDSLDFRDWFWEMKESTRYIAARSKGKQYTLAEDIRANRHQHLLNALGVQRTANLEHEISLEKEQMPSYWKPQPDLQFSTQTSRSSADAYTTPAPKRSELYGQSRGREHHTAELDNLVAELDMESFYDAEKNDEDRSLLHNHSPWRNGVRPTFDRHDTAASSQPSIKYIGATQYAAAQQMQLANIPSLEYNAGGRNSVPRNNHIADTHDPPSWLGRKSDRGNYVQVEDPPHMSQRQNLAPISYQSGNNQGHDHLQREGSATGRWWRSQWDRLSNTAPTHDYDDEAVKENDVVLDMAPPKIRQVAEGSWGRSSVPVSSESRKVVDPACVQQNYADARSQQQGEADSRTSSGFSPHSNSPLSHFIQTSRDSIDAKLRPSDQHQISPPEAQSSSKSQAMLVVQPDIPSRHPSITPSVSTNNHASQRQVQTEAQDADVQPKAPAQTALPPAVGPKGKLFNIVLPTPLSPARYPYGQEGSPVTTPDTTSRTAPVFSAPSPPSIIPVRSATQDSSPAPATASALKWALPAKSPKRESAAMKHSKSTSNGMITPGALSLTQARAREASEAEAEIQAKMEAEAQAEVEAKERAGRAEAEAQEKAQRAEIDRRRMLVEEQRRTSFIHQEQQRQTSVEYAARQLQTSPPKRVENAGPRIMLPAPSQLALVESEDRYRPQASAARQREDRSYQPRNSTLSIPTSLTPSNGSNSGFEVGSIVPRPAVFRASGAPLKAYYSQIYHQHQQQQRVGPSYAQAMPQINQYARYHQERQSQIGRQSMQVQEQPSHIAYQPAQYQDRSSQLGHQPAPRQQQMRQPQQIQSQQYAPSYPVQPANRSYGQQAPLQGPYGRGMQHPYYQQ